MMTEEHKLKLKEAREKAKEERNRNKTPDERKDEIGNQEVSGKLLEPDLSDKMDSMISGLNTVASAISKLVELQTLNKEEKKEETKKSPELTFTPKLDDETYPSAYIPPKFRKIVDDTLSPDFGIQVLDFINRTDFQLNIIVPDKYSSVAKEDKDRGLKDVRSRMIPRALGENGVKDWCTLIRRNLNKFYTKEGVQSPFNNQIQQ